MVATRATCSGEGNGNADGNMNELMTGLHQALQGGHNAGDRFFTRNKEFKALGGQSFSGEEGAVAADNWIRKCEFVFPRMQLTEVQKQELATQQLDKAAMNWWKNIRADPQIDAVNMTWEAFKDHFLRRFVPDAVKDQMAKEFEQLTQGGGTVSEYVTKFNELSHYAPHLIDTVERKNKKFINGLGYFISNELIPFDGEPFDRVLDLALRYEEKGKQFREERMKNKTKVDDAPRHDRSFKHHRDNRNRYMPYDQRQGGHGYQGETHVNGTQYMSNGGNFQGYQNHRQEKSQGPQRPPAPQLNYRPPVPQLTYRPQVPQIAAIPTVGQQGKVFDGRCFGCGQEGHSKKLCPQKGYPPQGQQGQGQVVPVRAFAAFQGTDNV